MEMKGQWIGKYKSQGGVDGKLIINIDKVKNHFEGAAFRYTDDKTLNSVAYFSTNNLNSEQNITTDIYPVNPKNGRQISWKVIENTEIKLEVIDDKLHVDASSGLGFTLTSVLTKSSKNDGSKIEGEKMSWRQFKSHISGTLESQCLFRGQKEPWKLRTSFHQQGRYRIDTFANKDVQELHQRLSSITSHFFDRTDPIQNGSFWNLLQHHGYPTPLLDWSYAPSVAAFFAFREWPKDYDGEEHARIYLFDNDAWKNNYPQIADLITFFPHLSVMNFVPIDNPRIVPQQAVTTITNIDDIEAYVLELESQNNTQYLQAIDIPANQREEVMSDLKFMGITEDSMFPSIDRVCEELKERNFDK